MPRSSGSSTPEPQTVSKPVDIDDDKQTASYVILPPKTLFIGNNPPHMPFVVALGFVKKVDLNTNPNLYTAHARLGSYIQPGYEPDDFTPDYPHEIESVAGKWIKEDVVWTPREQTVGARSGETILYFVFRNANPFTAGTFSLVVDIMKNTGSGADARQTFKARLVHFRPIFVPDPRQYTTQEMEGWAGAASTGQMQVFKVLIPSISKQIPPDLKLPFTLEWVDTPPARITNKALFPSVSFKTNDPRASGPHVVVHAYIVLHKPHDRGRTAWTRCSRQPNTPWKFTTIENGIILIWFSCVTTICGFINVRHNGS
ncbi:hypothetical protein QBC38DRAFT_530600 [Podospora fimiseda]|uniref:Uncharacterized protein n=1 Tax=Podospora fimiseda TaxID=252190 RepID=A0AAN7H7N2_9PEZI|nr:hypothetical protein QBC38DRAFT_530600 [Podospora fimiseda]